MRVIIGDLIGPQASANNAFLEKIIDDKNLYLLIYQFLCSV